MSAPGPAPAPAPALRSPVSASATARRGAGIRYLRYLLPLFLGVTALALVYGRFTWQARQGVRAAQVAVAQGDTAEAVRCYRDALRAYVPGSPYERRALDGLQALAAAARATGDSLAERRAWEAVRVGLLSTRSLYLPHASRYGEAQRRLAELDAAAAFPPVSPPDLPSTLPSSLPSSRTVPVAPELAVVSARGNAPGRSVRPLGPAIASTLVALLGFALWVGSIVLLIRRGIARHPVAASPHRPAALVLGGILPPVLFVVGFTLFLLGLRFT